MMVGRDVSFNVEKSIAVAKEPLLVVENLYYKENKASKDVLSNINFNVRRGEIVTIAGVDGNGQSELIKIITGLLPLTSGNYLI